MPAITAPWPMPISTRPETSPATLPAAAKTTRPSTARRFIVLSMMRGPKRSKSMPAGSCTAAAARNMLPMMVPTSAGL